MPPELRTRLMNMSDILLAMLRRQRDPGLRVQTYHEGNFLTSLAVAATFTPVVSFTLPNMMQGQLERFTYGCEILSDFDQVIWQIRADGAPLQNFDFMQGPSSTFVFPNTLATPIPLRAGATIEVAARALIAAGPIAAVLTGSFWPSQGPEHQQDYPGHVTAQL